MDYIIDSAVKKLKRTSEWNDKSNQIIGISDSTVNIRYFSASFIYEDKWNHATSVFSREIILDNNKLIWAKDDWPFPNYFVYMKNKLYAFYYKHDKRNMHILTIYNNNEILNLDIETDKIDDNSLDNLIYRTKNIRIECNEEIIDLSEYFDKQFFYKGPKWKKEYPPMDITVITNIQADNGLIRIEIENVTYPCSAYFILDLDG